MRSSAFSRRTDRRAAQGSENCDQRIWIGNAPAERSRRCVDAACARTASVGTKRAGRASAGACTGARQFRSCGAGSARHRARAVGRSRCGRCMASTRCCCASGCGCTAAQSCEQSDRTRSRGGCAAGARCRARGRPGQRASALDVRQRAYRHYCAAHRANENSVRQIRRAAGAHSRSSSTRSERSTRISNNGTTRSRHSREARRRNVPPSTTTKPATRLRSTRSPRRSRRSGVPRAVAVATTRRRFSSSVFHAPAPR